MCQLKQCEASLEWAPGELWVKLVYTWYLHTYCKTFHKISSPPVTDLARTNPSQSKLTGSYTDYWVPLVKIDGYLPSTFGYGEWKKLDSSCKFWCLSSGVGLRNDCATDILDFLGFCNASDYRVRSSHYFLFSKVNTLMHISSNRVKCITFSCLQSVKIINKYSPSTLHEVDCEVVVLTHK